MQVFIPNPNATYVLEIDWEYCLPALSKNKNLGKELGYFLDTAKPRYSWRHKDTYYGCYHITGTLPAGTLLQFDSIKTEVVENMNMEYVKLQLKKDFSVIQVTLDSFNKAHLIKY